MSATPAAWLQLLKRGYFIPTILCHKLRRKSRRREEKEERRGRVREG